VFCSTCGCEHRLHFLADLTHDSFASTSFPVAGEILEDEYGIAVIPERFTDIVTGVDPSKFAQGSGRIGEEVMRRGFGFGADGKPVAASSSSGGRPVPGASSGSVR
jgi:hypothetical protein